MRRFLSFIALFTLLGTGSLLAEDLGNAPTSPKAQVEHKEAKKSKKSQALIDQLMPEEDLNKGAFENHYPDISAQAIVLVSLALMPFLVMLLTSYLKIIITLVLLRNALGVQQTPPSQVLNGMALILSIYVMFPTGVAMYHAAKPEFKLTSYGSIFMTKESATTSIKIANKAKEPLREFLIRNTPKAQIKSFMKIAEKSFPEELGAALTNRDFLVVIPAFILGQIKSAFEIGVLIYLPFLVIDLVTANILVAMQMMMLSPLSISLPLKLLLIVMIDGWTLLIQGLMISFR